MQINTDYFELLNEVLHSGNLVECRGHKTVEVINQITLTNMEHPLVTLSKRKMGYRFACAEAAWILSGDPTVYNIEHYSPTIKNFSDDGHFFFGAYGPKIIDQLEYIGRAFEADLMTRQAVINIWREKPPVSKDIPCTLNVQFMIRKHPSEDCYRLHTTVNMRSSDIWLGVPYDWFSFSMLSAYVAIYLRNRLKLHDHLFLGQLVNQSMSRHFYESNEVGIIDLVDNPQDFDFDYKPIDLDQFEIPQDLVTHLWMLAKEKSCFDEITFLKELTHFWKEKEEK